MSDKMLEGMSDEMSDEMPNEMPNEMSDETPVSVLVGRLCGALTTQEMMLSWSDSLVIGHQSSLSVPVFTVTLSLSHSFLFGNRQ